MDRRKTIWSGITGAIASVLAFLGVVSCCGMPILAGGLAALGIGASQLSFFAEYKGWFIAFAIIALIYGFYQAYFRSAKNCCASSSESDTKEKKRSILPKVFLWIGTFITLAALFTATPENSDASASGCCPSQVSSSCTSGCKTDSSACCATSGNQQYTGTCCSSQQETIRKSCCGD